MSTGDQRRPDAPDGWEGSWAAAFRLVRPGGEQVLHLGCGDGSFGGALTNFADKEVTGIEDDDVALEAAAQAGLRRVIRADVADTTAFDALVGSRFDVVLITDPEGRLPDPVATLRALVDRALLGPGAYVVLVITSPGGSGADPGEPPRGRNGVTRPRSDNGAVPLWALRRDLTLEGLTPTHVERIDIDDPAPAQLPRWVLRLEASAGHELGQLRSEVHRLRGLLRRERRARKRADSELATAARDRELLGARLKELHASRTWRVGRIIVGGPAALRRRLRP